MIALRPVAQRRERLINPFEPAFSGSRRRETSGTMAHPPGFSRIRLQESVTALLTSPAEPRFCRAARPAAALAALSILLPLIVGCGGSASGPPHISERSLQAVSNEEILEQLDQVLDFTYQRQLNTKDHAAWQILHGALAFRRDFLVEHDGAPVSAVDHLLDGGYLNGWTVRRGYDLSAFPRSAAAPSADDSEASTDQPRYGLKAILESGSRTGQGHADQWFAVLAQCGLQPTQRIWAGGHRYTMEDFLRQVQLDVHQNVLQEYSWTLIGLTTYLPTDAEWTDAEGKPWSIADLVQMEAEHTVGDGACGGTHRLIGLTMALNRHLDQGGKLQGAWKLADQRIRTAIQNARRFQNDDGSFSTNYLVRSGRSPDLAQNLGTTGHVLEFLTLALTVEQLQEPWVQRAVLNLCDLFRKTKNVPLECGALYHAAHGLVLYRERVYGHRDYLVAAAHD